LDVGSFELSCRFSAIVILMMMDDADTTSHSIVRATQPERCRLLSVAPEMEDRMAGGSKPQPGSKRPAKSQDGGRSAGGIKTPRHAGPGRASKTKPSGSKGSSLQKRMQP
jgi:hypothetical protein